MSSNSDSDISVKKTVNESPSSQSSQSILVFDSMNNVISLSSEGTDVPGTSCTHQNKPCTSETSSETRKSIDLDGNESKSGCRSPAKLANFLSSKSQSNANDNIESSCSGAKVVLFISNKYFLYLNIISFLSNSNLFFNFIFTTAWNEFE